MDGTTKNATSPFSLFGDKLKIIEVTLLNSECYNTSY
jgi:hypothetical protein